MLGRNTLSVVYLFIYFYNLWQSTTLYIKNFSEEITDAEISTEFSQFGSVTSASVVRGPDGVSRGFAFVSFSTAEEATRAVNEMNKKLWRGRPLYVSLAQRKDVRQRQLAEEMAVRPLRRRACEGAACLGGAGCKCRSHPALCIDKNS